VASGGGAARGGMGGRVGFAATGIAAGRAPGAGDCLP
jgi:hypothetical protein